MGIMDIMGLMGGGDESGGMMSQIKAAGESFGAMAKDIDTLKAQNAEIIARLSRIYILLKQEGTPDE